MQVTPTIIIDFPTEVSENEKKQNIPYIISQNGKGRGFFSILSSVVCHVHLGISLGFKPIADFTNCGFEYSEKEPCNDTTDPWLYYFNPLSELSLGELSDFSIVARSTRSFPKGYPTSISRHPFLKKTFQDHITINSLYSEEALSFYDKNLGEKSLGVHFRAQEFRRTPRHRLPPTNQQIFTAIDNALDLYDIENIFLVSEDVGCVNTVRNRYGKKVVTADHFRTKDPQNAYHMYPRKQHKYLLGKEILLDAILLSMCDGLVCCNSNVGEGARLIRKDSFKFEYQIFNPLNHKRRWIAKHLWNAKSILPTSIGGFSAESVLKYENGVPTNHIEDRKIF
jgi:hypothetical protein